MAEKRAQWRPCGFRSDERITRRMRRHKALCARGVDSPSPEGCEKCLIPDEHRDAKKWRAWGDLLLEPVRLWGKWRTSPDIIAGIDLPVELTHALDAALAAADRVRGGER